MGRIFNGQSRSSSAKYNTVGLFTIVALLRMLCIVRQQSAKNQMQADSLENILYKCKNDAILSGMQSTKLQMSLLDVKLCIFSKYP